MSPGAPRPNASSPAPTSCAPSPTKAPTCTPSPCSSTRPRAPGSECIGGNDSDRLIRDAGRALREADKAWAGLTTATRPTHEFVTASRTLFATLHDVTTAAETAPDPVDTDRALRDLAHGTDQLTLLLTATDHLPDRLIDSGLLHTPATKARPTLERLNDRAKGRLVIAETLDAPNLADRWRDALDASREAARMIGRDMAQRHLPPRPTSAEPVPPLLEI